MAEKSGRKKAEPTIDKTVFLHLRLSQKQKDRLVEEARRLGMGMSEYVRFVLVSQFKEQDREDREERMSRIGG